MHNVIIYGGTFDPPHYAHINVAINVQNHFNFERFLFLPCRNPALKNKPIASPSQRIEMLKLALVSQDQTKFFAIDLFEYHQNTPSYLVHSLQHLRKQYGQSTSLTFLMGADTFSQLPRWHDWSKLLTLTNLLVIKRSGFAEETYSDLIKDLLLNHETKNEKAITQQTHGLIYRYDAGSYHFSSTWIRNQLSAGKDLAGYLPEPVIEYIKQNNLYYKPN